MRARSTRATTPRTQPVPDCLPPDGRECIHGVAEMHAAASRELGSGAAKPTSNVVRRRRDLRSLEEHLPFHGGNTGSIPVGRASEIRDLANRTFVRVPVVSWQQGRKGALLICKSKRGAAARELD